MIRTQIQAQAQAHIQTQPQSQPHAYTQAQGQVQSRLHEHSPASAQMQGQADTAGFGSRGQGYDPMSVQAQHEANVLAQVPDDFTLTEVPAESLITMIEEERMAGDIYEVLAQQTGLIVFDKIAVSEDRHYDSLVTLAQAASIDLSGIAGLPAGQYADPELQALYDSLIAQAASSTQSALEVGAQIETIDIEDLEAAMVDVVGTPLWNAYSQLLQGSQNHLAAFDGLIGG